MLLVRHFFGRFFDKESLSPQGEPTARLAQTLGLLAAPAAFFILLFLPLTFWGWSLVFVRHLFLAFSMVVMGIIMVFEWDALFPDRRDYQILTTLPIRLSTLFLAKAAALAIFLGVFLLDLNFFSVLFWPGIDGGKNALAILSAHATVMLLGGLFSALAIAALQGVLITVLPGRVLRPVSMAMQTLLMAVLVMLLFLSPMIGFSVERLVKTHSALLNYYPGFWFIGFYERLRPATRNSPELLRVGGIAIRALWCAAVVFAITYLPLYRRHARRMLEAPEPNRLGAAGVRGRAAGLLDRLLLKSPIEQAVFHFMSQTITRSVKHRLFLATYGGFGAAIAVLTLGSGSDGLLRLPLSLSFVLISGLRAAFNFPSELSANWAFQITETCGVRGYLAAMRKWIVLCAILPLFALIAPVEFIAFPPAVALFYLAFGIALSLLLMEILFFGFRKVPFTCSHFPGKVNLVGLSAAYLLGFTYYSSSMARLEAWLTEMPFTAALFFAVVAAVCVLLRRLGEREVSETGRLDYEEPVDPVVRTLDLNPQ